MNAVMEQTGATEVTIEMMRALASELPLNDFGLPTGIYRPDLLPLHLYVPPGTPTDLPRVQATGQPEAETVGPPIEDSPSDEPVEQPPIALDDDIDLPEPQADPFSLLSGQGDGLPDFIQVEPTREVVAPSQKFLSKDYRVAGFPPAAIGMAFVPLYYDEGFPAFEGGTAFWDRLPYESMESFQVFQRYLYMSRGVAPKEDDAGKAASGLRSINTLVMQMHPTADDHQVLMLSERYQNHYHMNYWALRAKAYDFFRVAQYRQQQELRAIETCDDHYLLARKLRGKLMEYMDGDEDFWDMMTPKTGIDMLKTLTQLERISAGIPGGGPANERNGDSPGFGSLEIAFRTIAQSHAGHQERGSTLDEGGSILDAALDDSAVTEILQQLIIRTTGGNKP